ncbi:hypothetical protein Tco_0550299 [Tanacetum coccineum]
MDSNPSRPPVSTPVDIGMHKEDQQVTSSPTSLGSPVNKPIYSASFIIHFEYASRNNASAVSTAEADPRISTPSTDPHGRVDKTKSVSNGLESILTIPEIGTSIAAKTIKEIKFEAIKLKDLAKLVPNFKVDFKDLDSSEDDPIIVVDDSEKDEEEDKNEEIYSTINNETGDISASTPLSPRLKAQPSFPNVGQLNKILVKSLTAEFSKILSAHNFSSLLPSELKDLSSKFNELTEEVKGLKQQVASVQAKLKTMDALPSLLLNVTKALKKFAQVFDFALSKARDQGVPSAGQADNMPAEGEKNTNQATIS